MLGIDDPMIWLAYAGCIGATLIALIYGLIRRNAASDTVSAEDVEWAKAEREVEDEF
jgi:hypothetical protein